jgi:2-polyprenyl-6-methoxyphenol hydroxylase-like FAD-dependent oxidoreductase
MKNVLISGAGIAGPALALGLSRSGVRCDVVERATELRRGGQAVDFRGPVHRAVLERMDLWNAIEARRTSASGLALLDRRGDVAASLPEVMFAGDVEILRGDLCALLYERTHGDVDYRFGDRVDAIARTNAEVEVTFRSGRVARYDLVVAADGLHSCVRGLAFGDEREFLRHHDYRIATFAMPSWRGPRGSYVYSAPSRGVFVTASDDGARALLVWRGDPFGDERWDVPARKEEIAKTYGALGWEVPRVLEALASSTDLYVDAIATAHVPRWSKGRVVLLGDAAWGATLGGHGASLAVVGAHVLAGELASTPDLATALDRYESRLRSYALGCQKVATRAGSFFAPTSGFGIAARNFVYRVLTSRVFIGFFEKLVTQAATDFVLPEYVMKAGAPAPPQLEARSTHAAE